MDRTTELKSDYAAMQGIMERFQHRQTLKVDPKPTYQWCLFEKEGRASWIEQYNPEMVVYMKKHWEQRGWTITFIDIFRTGANGTGETQAVSR